MAARDDEGADRPSAQRRAVRASAASLIASSSVGCAWQVRARSSDDAPNSIASARAAADRQVEVRDRRGDDERQRVVA
jgi:hypothetical protein